MFRFALFVLLLTLINQSAWWQPAEAQSSIGLPSDIEWSPDGTKIAGAGLNLLRVWDASSGEVLVDFETVRENLTNLDIAWHPEGTMIASATADKRVRIWNVSAPNYSVGQLVATIEPTNDGGLLWCVEWSPDGKRLATGGTHERFTLKLWDASDYSLVSQTAAGWITHLSWNPNLNRNEVAIANENDGAYIWFLDQDSTSSPLSNNLGAASYVKWSSSGNHLAVGNNNGNIFVWDALTDQLKTVMIDTPQDFVDVITWSADEGLIASANGERIIRVWNSTTGELVDEIPTSQNVFALDFSPIGNQLAYGGDNGTIHIVTIELPI